MRRKRARTAEPRRESVYQPPEDWHEPLGSAGFEIIEQAAGSGYTHILTPQQIRDRLSQLPSHLVRPLEVVQLSRMTKKKRGFPCYGMQWGSSIYLYPLENDLVEYFARPPRPAEFIEARQFGGKWVQQGAEWRLEWTRAAIEDFYLNNVLIHELGHLLDDRNTSFRDRERYAEWFALEYGYKPTRAARSSQT